MENAIKAIYMGAGMLLGVLVLGVLVYMFRTAGRTSESYEFQKGTEQIQAFNIQFENYQHSSEQDGSSENFSFITKGNTVFDVVSCANLAFDINNKNDYDLTNSVIVNLQIGSNTYHIYPFRIQEKNKFICDLSFDNVRNLEDSNGSIDDTKYYDFYEFLSEKNDIRIVNIDGLSYKSSNETIYRYYFDVDESGITYSETTGKVDSITFVQYETKKFDEPNGTYWVDI